MTNSTCYVISMSAGRVVLRGVIEVQSGRTAEAAESIRLGIRKDPTRAAANALLGERSREALSS